MTNKLASWPRRFYTPGGGEPFLFYVAFGEIRQDEPLSSHKYRCLGVPDGLNLMEYDRTQDSEVLAGFMDGYLWDSFQSENPDLAARVQQSPTCLVLRGDVIDPPSLDYLRDSVGLLTYLLDQGAFTIYDPQMLQWWTPPEWRERIFDPAGPVPSHHVTILLSEEEDGSEALWIHTRGMRKFGRPDLSVHNVGPEYQDAVIDMCNRFIEYQAFGGIIAEGESIRTFFLPPGGVAHHAGDFDDFDFNNVHVEIVWPEGGLSGDAVGDTDG